MSKRIHKISELERLQAKKARLLIDVKSHAKALDQHLDYLQNNFGDLLLNTTKGAIIPKLPPLIRNFLPASFESSDAMEQHPDTHKSKTSMVVDQLLDFAPLFFKGSKPVVVAFLLKKAKEMIFRKKK